MKAPTEAEEHVGLGLVLLRSLELPPEAGVVVMGGWTQATLGRRGECGQGTLLAATTHTCRLHAPRHYSAAFQGSYQVEFGQH